MNITNVRSLVATLDTLNDALFFDRPVSKAQRDEAAAFIISRLAQPGSYAGLFAPTADDFKRGARVFTGEWVRSNAGLAHVFGEEACRALILMESPRADVKAALRAAGEEMIRRLDDSESRGHRDGMYCCGRCSAALWRHLGVGGLAQADRRLAAGLKTLNSHRDDRGRWRRFPFYYTLLALADIHLPTVLGELRFAAPALERSVKRAPTGDKFDLRRRALAERILARV